MAEIKTIVKRKANPAMNQKDRAEIKNMLIDAMKTHSENTALVLKSHSENVELYLKGKFEVIEVKLDNIEKQTTKTNGRVTANETEIQKLKEVNIGHVMNCPNTAKIATLEQMEFGRKAVSSFSWKQIGLIGAIAGLVLSLLTFLLK